MFLSLRDLDFYQIVTVFNKLKIIPEVAYDIRQRFLKAIYRDGCLLFNAITMAPILSDDYSVIFRKSQI